MKKGFAIILVLATLVLLALLAITYITLSLTDRTIARNYMDQTRSRLIAQSGIEYAIARLQEDFFDTSWQYDRQNPQVNPSFKAGEVVINGQTRGYSQIAGSTYSPNGDLFVLKIDDSQASININDGLSANTGGNPGVRANLARIINNLAKIIDPAFPDLGTNIIGDKTNEKRPKGGYSTVNELKKVLTDKYGPTGEDYYNRLKPFITTHAWQDPNVANPVALSSRYGRGKNYKGQTFDQFLGGAYSQLKFAPDSAVSDSLDHAIYALDELNPQYVEIVSRSPVNINRAERETIVALIEDLKGFFVSERRRNYPNSDWSYSLLLRMINVSLDRFTYSQENLIGDELGFLYTTEEFDRATAEKIADAIIACGKKETITIDGKTLDFTAEWFAGPIKSWRQFNAFCNYLKKEGIIKDSRDIFWEYDLTPFSAESPKKSDIAKGIAAQAKADVLKANFNPNLHLNELNPDANIATLVDKTDLIVNSTEFCFTSMGYFEIESEGYVLIPQGTDNTVVSYSNVYSVVRLFNVYRESLQSQFLNGKITSNAVEVDLLTQEGTTQSTNSKLTLDLGPEPSGSLAQRDIARENEWDGYIALAVLNGLMREDFDYTYKEKGKTYILNDNTLLIRFLTNFKADYHEDNTPVNLTDQNSPDPTEPVKAGPYIYGDTSADGVTRHTLCKSYRSAAGNSYAPADLRIDGAYIERHSGLAYNVSANVMTDTGFFCYWIKPWFRPESTGKPRTYLSLSSKTGSYMTGLNASVETPYIFANYFLASQYWTVSELITITYNTGTPNPFFVPMSMLFGYSSRDSLGPDPGAGFGEITRTLNHTTHSDNRANYLMSGQWAHIIGRWNMGTNMVDVLVNNSWPYFANQDLKSDHGTTTSMGKILGYTQRLRIGEPVLTDLAPDPYRSWTADSTIDELYLFKITDITEGQKIYERGRYYKPEASEAYFISGMCELPVRHNPKETIVSAPGGASASGSTASPTIKIIGISFTWHGEAVDKSGKVVLKNYKEYEASAGYKVEDFVHDPATADANRVLFPKVSIKLIKNGTELVNEYVDDSYSPVKGVVYEIDDEIKYKVTLSIQPDSAGVYPLNATLLYTPVFDDITIFYHMWPTFIRYVVN